MSRRTTVTADLKQKIVAEYINTGVSLRSLQAKYGYDFRTIGAWVSTHKKATKALSVIKPEPRFHPVRNRKPRVTSSTLMEDLAVLSRKHGLNLEVKLVEGTVTGVTLVK